MGFRLANVGGRAALVAGDHFFDITTVSSGSLSSDPMKVLTRTDRLTTLAASLGDHTPTGMVADATLGPPVTSPQKVFGIGLNYLDHAAEGAMQVPDNPLVFTKFPSCLVGPNANVEMRSDYCDYEGELHGDQDQRRIADMKRSKPAVSKRATRPPSSSWPSSSDGQKNSSPWTKKSGEPRTPRRRPSS